MDDFGVVHLPWILLPLKEHKADREIVLAAVSKSGNALEYAAEELRGDREIVLAAVSQCCSALRHATEELKGDHEIVLAAVSNDGYALEHATEELKGDREIVLAAVSENGHALLYATEELKGNRKIVLAAVSNEGYALQYATKELKGDREIVLAAVSPNGLALNHAANGLKVDEEMMRHALEQSPDQLAGLKVSLLSGRCCGLIVHIKYLCSDIGRRWALGSCAASLELDRDLVERTGTFVCGPIEVKDFRELEPGRVHELTLVMPWHSLACSVQYAPCGEKRFSWVLC